MLGVFFNKVSSVLGARIYQGIKGVYYMNKNKLMTGIAGTSLAIGSLTAGNAHAEGKMIDAFITDDAACSLGTVAMDFDLSELNSNGGDQSQAPSIKLNMEPNVAVIETPVELINYTDGPAKFILKSITDNKFGHYVTKDKVKVEAGAEQSTSVYTATPNNGTYKIKVRAKGLGPINSTKNINVSETCK